MTISGRVKFDALGRTIEQHQLTYEGKGTPAAFRAGFGGNETVTDYDALNRTIQVKLPDNSITAMSYETSTQARWSMPIT